MMLKKYTAIFFLTVAYSFLLGHNIIPHHHVDHDHNSITEHHQTNHHHSGDGDSEDLIHFFSHFIHSTDALTTTAIHNISNNFSKQQPSLYAVLPDNFSLSEIQIPLLLYNPHLEHLYLLAHSLGSGLRAPPAFIS